jgi:hypothetical protein
VHEQGHAEDPIARDRVIAIACHSGVTMMIDWSHCGYSVMGKNVPENKNSGSSRKCSQFS